MVEGRGHEGGGVVSGTSCYPGHWVGRGLYSERRVPCAGGNPVQYSIWEGSGKLVAINMLSLN